MSFRAQLKQAWQNLARSEEGGEFLPYAEKCRLLGVSPPVACTGYLPPPEPGPRRFVALNLGPGLGEATVSYAIGTAQRLEAGIILLHHPGGAPAPVVVRARATIEAAGLYREEEDITGPWQQGITAFLRRRPSVACLVVGPDDVDPRQLPHRPRAGRGRALPAPLVVVQARPQPA